MILLVPGELIINLSSDSVDSSRILTAFSHLDGSKVTGHDIQMHHS